MGYLNGEKVLPRALLASIQEYVDGGYVYIPRRADSRRQWGESTQSRRRTAERNNEIRRRYLAGTPVEELARDYFLSPKRIYSVLSAAKK